MRDKVYDLAIIIPSRNEEFLSNTVEDILKNKRGNTEIIVILDGKHELKPLPEHKDLVVVYTSEPFGQREATNQGVRLTQAKYIMKCDAHCAFDEGFDIKMMDAFKEVGDNVTMVPAMYNLHVFDWKCKKCGSRWYMGPSPRHCMVQREDGTQAENPNCDNIRHFEKRLVWKPRWNRRTEFWMFDSEPHFQYYNNFKKRPEFQKPIADTMSLIGACFMLTRERYWKLNICDKDFGSWGSQGIEVAVKSYTSGGKVMVNKNTWFAHCFRTQKGFGFPYPQSNTQVQNAKQKARELFFGNKWEGQIYPLSYMVNKFLPLPGWSEKDLEQLHTEELKTERSGIYSITSKSNGRIYIGSSINISNRIFEHLRKLRQKSHNNTHLQNNYDKYGETDLVFNIVRFCSNDELLKFEQQYIDEFKEKVGWDNMFNIAPTAGSSLGRECSDETKQKISESKIGSEPWNKGLTKENDERIRDLAEKKIGINIWENNEHPKGMLGKHHSQEIKEQISETMSGVTENRERNENGQFV